MGERGLGAVGGGSVPDTDGWMTSSSRRRAERRAHAGEREPAPGLRPTAARLFAGPGEALFAVAVIAAGIGAAAGWRPAGYLLIAVFGARLAAHLAAGFANFRTTMERPWPQVQPRAFDDED